MKEVMQPLHTILVLWGLVTVFFLSMSMPKNQEQTLVHIKLAIMAVAVLVASIAVK